MANTAKGKKAPIDHLSQRKRLMVKSIEDQISTTDSQWKFLGMGSYNYAFCSADRLRVLKIQQTSSPSDTDCDTPIRSVRLWNEINPGLPAYIERHGRYTGWSIPFVEGRQSTDREIQSGIIDIFNRTGRIILDACAKHNFLTTPEGRVYCIDIGMALLMDQKTILRRTNSTTSLSAWKKFEPVYKGWFQENTTNNPLAIQTIKALLVIQQFRPDIVNVDFLKQHSELMHTLSQSYDSPTHNYLAEGALNKVSPIRSTHSDVKDICVTKLEQYIASRGRIEINGTFKKIGWFGAFWRDTNVTMAKVIAAHKLIIAIQKSESLEDMQTLITHALENKRNTQGLSSDMKKVLHTCLAIVDTTIEKAPHLPTRQTLR